MNYIEKKLIVSQEKLNAGFIELYSQLYPLPKHWDDSEKTRMRDADIRNGTIVPTPVMTEDGVEAGAFYIVALWPEQFIKDIENWPNVTLPPKPNVSELNEEESANALAVYGLICEAVKNGLKGLVVENK